MVTVKTSKTLHNQKYTYNVPFDVAKESIGLSQGSQNGPLQISGIAINATTTRNGHIFSPEELGKSGYTLNDQPLLKDHINSVDAIVGRTTMDCGYDAANQCVKFSANIMDEDVKTKVNDGRIKSVSVGALVETVEAVELEDGTTNYNLKGITFVELSLVAVPADPNAGLSQAVMSSLDITENKTEKPQMITDYAKAPEIQPSNPIAETTVAVKADELSAEEAKLMSETKTELQMLQEKIEAAKVENARLEAQKLELQNEALAKHNEALKAKATESTQSTKGVVAPVAQVAEAKMPFTLMSENGMMSITADYAAYGCTRLVR